MRHLFIVLVFLVACEPEINWNSENNAALVEVCADGYFGDGTHGRACGVGFFRNSDQVFSAYHVAFFDREGFEVHYIDVFHGDQKFSVVDIDADIDADTVLITVDTSQDIYLEMCDTNASHGDDVFVAGFYNGEVTLYGGWVERSRHVLKAGWMYTSIPAHRGESGAPIVDSARGCVTGLTHGGVDGHATLGPGAELIRELFDF